MIVRLICIVSVAIGAVLANADVASANKGEGSCCEYNDKRIADCHFHMSKNELMIEWSDGVSESYKLISEEHHGTQKTYVDKRGGIWEFILYPQGNVSLTNVKNGNRIFKPLRGCNAI